MSYSFHKYWGETDISTIQSYLTMRNTCGGDNAWSDMLRGVRSRITINIGKPFGPFDIKGSKDEKMSKLESYSRELMCRIAALLPSDRHGEYSGDKSILKYQKQNELDLF